MVAISLLEAIARLQMKTTLAGCFGLRESQWGRQEGWTNLKANCEA